MPNFILTKFFYNKYVPVLSVTFSYMRNPYEKLKNTLILL